MVSRFFRLSTPVGDERMEVGRKDVVVGDKKRRLTSDGNMSPSKIRVQDLSLSPRKAAAVISQDDDVKQNESTGKRTSPRVRKPSEQVFSSDHTSGSLLERLDALTPGAGDSSTAESMTDSSYRPPVPRTAKTGRGSGRRKAKDNDVVEDKDGDVFMASVPERSGDDTSATRAELGAGSKIASVSKKGHGKGRAAPPPLVFRSLSDSEDSLPSPGALMKSIMEGNGKGVSVISEGSVPMGGGSSGAGSAGNRIAIGAVRDSPDWDESEIEKGVNGCEAQPLSRAAIFDASEKRNKDENGSSGVNTVGQFGRNSGKSRMKGAESLAVGSDADTRNASVFLTAVPDSDEGSSGDEDEVALEQAQGSGVVPLLNSDLIHPELSDLYASISWINQLRRCKFMGYTNMEDAFDDFAAISYGVLLDSVQSRVRSKLVRSMLFKEYKVFKNLSRVSLAGSVRSWECIRVPRAEGSRNVACVLTGVSMRSHVALGREVGESMVKQLYVRPIENDWDILQCNIGTYFNDASMHAPGRNSALVFQTKRQGWSPRRSDADKGEDKLASTPYSSPSKGGASKGVSKEMESPSVGEEDVDVSSVNILESGVPPYRLFQEGIPVYDGRTRPGMKGFRFEPSDWEKYDLLPRYPFAEVEDRSLVTVVYTLTGFRIGQAQHHTIHFNALFAIVLGKVDV
ncbi:hypothetical protein VNI00_005500 [Paramarasmius palmivorus]|uniref:Uncharacterized protein n=1 Tax=Paramarasmius palmivorus TaxID=297713 RepID=A0AAW0DEG0_9AGAR